MITMREAITRATYNGCIIRYSRDKRGSYDVSLFEDVNEDGAYTTDDLEDAVLHCYKLRAAQNVIRVR